MPSPERRLSRFKGWIVDRKQVDQRSLRANLGTISSSVMRVQLDEMLETLSPARSNRRGDRAISSGRNF
jgi:hypothetical protein